MKAEIINYLLDLNEKGINGEINPLEAYIDLKSIESCLKDVLKGLQEDAINEAEKYGKGEHEAFGAKFNIRNGATRYDFKKIAEWAEMSAKLKAFEEARKSIIKSGQSEVYDANGELIELPIVKPGATTIAIKL